MNFSIRNKLCILMKERHGWPVEPNIVRQNVVTLCQMAFNFVTFWVFYLLIASARIGYHTVFNTLHCKVQGTLFETNIRNVLSNFKANTRVGKTICICVSHVVCCTILCIHVIAVIVSLVTSFVYLIKTISKPSKTANAACLPLDDYVSSGKFLHFQSAHVSIAVMFAS